MSGPEIKPVLAEIAGAIRGLKENADDQLLDALRSIGPDARPAVLLADRYADLPGNAREYLDEMASCGEAVAMTIPDDWLIGPTTVGEVEGWLASEGAPDLWLEEWRTFRGHLGPGDELSEASLDGGPDVRPRPLRPAIRLRPRPGRGCRGDDLDGLVLTVDPGRSGGGPHRDFFRVDFFAFFPLASAVESAEAPVSSLSVIGTTETSPVSAKTRTS